MGEGAEGPQGRTGWGALLPGWDGVVPRGDPAQSLEGGAEWGQVSVCGPGTQGPEGFVWGF